MIQLTTHFRRDAFDRHSEWLRQQQWFIRAQMDRQHRTEVEERTDNDLFDLAVDVLMASQDQIIQFGKKLDRYDEATVRALMKNQESLEEVNARLDALLDRAYVMQDGRRVFKTDNGTKVFDEFGQEVSSDELDSNLISPDPADLGGLQAGLC